VEADLALFRRNVETRRVPLVRRQRFDFNDFVYFPGRTRAALRFGAIAPFSSFRCSTLRAFVPGRTAGRAGSLCPITTFAPRPLRTGVLLVFPAGLRPSLWVRGPFASRALMCVTARLRFGRLCWCWLCWTREYQFRYELADAFEDWH
jgi:hypothetical protein